MKKILLDPGMIPFDSFKDTLTTFINKNNSISIITEKRREYEWGQSDCELLIYQDLKKVQNVDIPEHIKHKYSSILNNIIDDHRTLLISERVSRIKSWHSLFYSTQVIEKIIYNCIVLLNRIKPDMLVFQATPHSLFSWVLAKTAESLEIKVLMIQTSPLPWRFWLIEGLDNQKPVFPSFNLDSEVQKNWILSDFWSTNTSSYKNALPSYEKERIESRGGKFWSWKKEISDALNQPYLFRDLLKKKKLYDLYRSLTVDKNDISGKKMILFLHYQPERTSLPEGKYYSQQWLIIRSLSMSLPDGWTLLVKEHPSIFTGKYDVRYRNPQFYKDIVELKNVKLISIEADTFELIDEVEAVATITGTVGVQSLMRGTPVFLFGYGSYRSAKGVIEVDSLNDIIDGFAKINAITKEELVSETERYLEIIYQKTISSLSQEDERGIDIYTRNVRLGGHLELLRLFFNQLK